MTARRTLLRALAGGVAGLAFGPQAWGQAILYTYDALGRIKSATYPNGQVTTYTYDAAGNRTQVQSSGSTPPSGSPAALAASASALQWSSFEGSEDPAVTVTATGGVAPYSYAWQRTSGHPGTGAQSPTSNATTWYIPPSIGFGVYSSTWVCVVTDAASRTAQTSSISVTFQVADPGCDPGSEQQCEIQ